MGIANIAANHGWSQALLGITIVMTGLFVLCLAISQIHKLVAFWERRQNRIQAPPSGPSTEDQGIPEAAADQCPADLNAMVAIYRPLTESLGAPFQLKDLYQLAAEYNLPHPYITIRCLREDGHLVAQGEGLFNWND